MTQPAILGLEKSFLKMLYSFDNYVVLHHANIKTPYTSELRYAHERPEHAVRRHSRQPSKR